MCNYYRGLSDVNSKEIIKRVIEFDHPERIGFDFILPNPTDITWITVTRLKNHMYDDRLEWGCYEEELKKIPALTVKCSRIFLKFIWQAKSKDKGECLRSTSGWMGEAKITKCLYMMRLMKVAYQIYCVITERSAWCITVSLFQQ